MFISLKYYVIFGGWVLAVLLLALALAVPAIKGNNPYIDVPMVLYGVWRIARAG